MTEKIITDMLARCSYKYKDLTKRDILTALSGFKELNPLIESYMYPNGASKDLVTLRGTIPVNFKNNRYNIPVQLYLADTHPYHAPIVYVRPTPDMTVHVSETVDPSGRVILPCIREWHFPQSDIYLLLNMMAIKFSEQTPLFARSSKSNASASTTTPSYPFPSSSSSNNSSSPYQSAASYQPPSSSIPVYPSQNSSQPPYPLSTNTPPYPTSANSQQPPYPTGSGSANPYYPSGGMPMPAYMQSNFGQIRTNTASASNTASSYADDTIKPQYYKLSIISAIIDKARLRFNELSEEKRAENDSLKRVHSDLEDSETLLRSYISDGEHELKRISDMTKELKSKTNQLSENINRMQHRENTKIEDAIITPAPLYRQLMNSFAEEMAITDLIYYMGVGLDVKTIQLDTFLRQVRFLSRKQFMLRATMQKAREKASLPN